VRILVYPHSMQLGGSQLNAIQLAGAVRDLGHEVSVVAEPGPLVDRIGELGLEHVQIPRWRRRPSPQVLAQLVRLVRDRDIDVVHGHEWPPAVEAFLGPAMLCRTPVVGTVMSMSVVPFFPRAIPLVVGTEQIRDAALAAGHRRVTVIEPPVDTHADHPALDGRAFRGKHGIAPDEILLAMVCRLAPELKLEGLLAACDATGELARSGRQVRLAIVGDGPAREHVQERAAQVNAAVQRRAIVLTGAIDHAEPAYAAADVVIGQGGSALRGMAFGKPLVVVGEDGFSELVTPDSAPPFLRTGWFGLGPGSRGTGATGLRRGLEGVVDSPASRRALGAFARALVVDRFGLERAARLQEQEYAEAVASPAGARERTLEATRCTTGVVAAQLRRKVQRRRGTARIDDANARPVR
jgi:glycosyltransferase involved in cell wall biosynthesis